MKINSYSNRENIAPPTAPFISSEKASVEMSSSDLDSFHDETGSEGPGEFQERTPTNILTYRDGSRYTGQLVNNIPYGFGCIVHLNDNIYTGEFRDGKIHGLGTFTSIKEGWVYTGQFQNNKSHGIGKLIRDDGHILEGVFENGELNGEGKYFYRGQCIYAGEFKNNKYHGQGSLNFSDTQYIGAFIDGLYHGNGRIIYPNGDELSCNFVNGLLHGLATIKMGNGETFQVLYNSDELRQQIDLIINNGDDAS
jgi:hypothetical protein